MKSSKIFAILLILFVSFKIKAQDGEVQPTLRHSCLNHKQFLSVTVTTPKRDGYPDVRIKLADPNGNTLGFEPDKHQMGESRYARIVEIPQHPNRSRAIAAETCKPARGKYKITLEEHGNSRYRLTISAEGREISVSKPLYLIASNGRKRFYEFNYDDSNGSVELLGQAGQPLTVTDFADLSEW